MNGPVAAVRLLVPEGAPLVSVASLATPLGRRRLRDVPPGGELVLYDDRPGARYRLRGATRRNHLAVDREYVVLPTWGRGTFIVEDAPGTDTLGWLWTTFATVPPGVTRGSLALSLVVRATRRAPIALRLLGRLAPGRFAIVSR